MVGALPTCANGATPKSSTLVEVDANAKVYGLMDLSPEQMVSYMPAEDEQEYVENLVNKSKDGTLTEIEKAELDYFVQMEHLLQMMRSRAAKILATRHAA